MNKTKQIIVVASVIALIFAVGLAVYFSGVKANDMQYIKVEVNPKIEFLASSNGKIKSVYPINDSAKELLIQETFIGENISDAINKYLELCARANYINCDGENNAIKISVVSGFMQKTEMVVYESVNNFLLNNEIFGIIIEGNEDLYQVKTAKELSVNSPNKLTLIESILEKTNEYTFDELNGKKEMELIKIIENITSDYDNNSYSIEELANKTKLIDFNRVAYNNHINAINNDTKREFATEFEEYKKENFNKYQVNFDQSTSNLD